MRIVILACVIGAFFTIHAAAQKEEIVIDSSGRKILLRADKTWDYKPEPKPAASPDVAAFIPDDVDSLLKTFEPIKDKIVKSEFETSAEFADRLWSLLSNTKNVKTQRLLTETVLMFEDLARYDAEAQRFVFSSATFRLMEITGSGEPQIEFAKRITKGFWISDGDLFRSSGGTLSFVMTPEKARVVKPNLALLVYGIALGMQYGKVQVVPLRYAAFNKETKEIYAKFEGRENPFQ